MSENDMERRIDAVVDSFREVRAGYSPKTTTWKIDGQPIEIPIPVSTSVEEAQERQAKQDERIRRINANAFRRVRPNG
jgi:hypothetical protein